MADIPLVYEIMHFTCKTARHIGGPLFWVTRFRDDALPCLTSTQKRLDAPEFSPRLSQRFMLE